MIHNHNPECALELGAPVDGAAPCCTGSEPMTKYTVTWQETVTLEAEIEAASPEQAIAEAFEAGNAYEVDSAVTVYPEVVERPE
jgi:hypothetical protein